MSPINHIEIKFIPTAEMRVPGCGDWWQDGETLHVRAVSDDADCNPFLIAVHELIEGWLCKSRGISETDVDAFDAQFERERDQGKHSFEDEPGDDPKAPYGEEHRFACLVEFMVAFEMGLTSYGTMR